jgi:GT2 family glycosyltransferase
MSRNDSSAVENRPCFSFIIVSYNTLPLTRAAISSIAKFASQFPHEVILVDNHSTDGSVTALRQEFVDLKIIALEENRGFAAANNAGAKIAAGDWLILMNSDAELLVNTMPVVDNLLRQNPELDVLGGQLIFPDGSLQTSAAGVNKYHRDQNEQRELIAVTGIVGAFMVIRHTLWRKLNGWDEGYFFYCEDSDFCTRAINAGAILRWSPRFRVIHHRNGSSQNVNLRAAVELWESQHYEWRKKMPEQEYRSKVRRCGFRFFFRVIWYFSLSLFTFFLLPAFTVRLRKYFHLLKWHLHGCPAGWGLRPVKNKPL